MVKGERSMSIQHLILEQEVDNSKPILEKYSSAYRIKNLNKKYGTNV